ncbi:serine hydrolase, partial [Verrucomicrobia bacterium]|nr:serine hydrolase [Verrucomicrobiota bacterium]
FDYCNSGYLLLGLIVEKVSGKLYGDFLQESFFKPLGMHQTGVHQKGNEPEGEALGHTKGLLGYKRANNWDMSWAGGAGDLYSTTGDLHRWNLGIFAGSVLSKDSLRTAFTPATLKDGTVTDYGYGWGIKNPGEQPTLMHGGGLDGFISFMAYSSKRKMTIVALTNTDSGYDPEAIFLQVATYWAKKETNSDWEVDGKLVGKNYNDYVGRYDYGVAILVVTRKDNQLFAKLGNQLAFEILPMAPDEFFLNLVEARVKFERDANGNIHHLIHHQNDETLKAPRLK